MKKFMSLLLAVCLLAALAVPVTAASTTRNVDLGTMAQTAINNLAKYNSTEVGQAFNTKTMMGYVFGTLCADDTYFQSGDNRYEHYKIPAATLEGEMNARFAGAQATISEMQEMKVDDYTFEFTKVEQNGLQVWQGAYYFFNKYNLDRTEIVKGNPKKSGTGFVVENPKTYTVNGYKAAGNYKYDVYATDNTGAIVKYVIEWGGGEIKFVSTAAASSLPTGLTAPGTQAALAVTTTTKATTTTTKKQPTTTTTTKPTAGNNGGGTTTTTTAVADDGNVEVTPDPTDNVTTTTTTKAQDSAAGDVNTDGAVGDTTEQDGEDNTTLYVIIGVVLGVIVLGIVAAIIIVVIKTKKK